MQNKSLINTSVVLFLLFMALEMSGQCPMCRIAAESNVKLGGTAAKGLNFGILYLFALPYLVVATLGILWWRGVLIKRKQKKAPTLDKGGKIN